MILGIYGYHKSGKTLFLENLIDELRRRGIKAAAVKHVASEFTEDESTDTGRLTRAGYDPVIAISDEMMTIRMNGFFELKKAISLVNLLTNVDIVFVEGFKGAPIDKIAIGDIPERPRTVLRVRTVLPDEFDEAVNFIIARLRDEKDLARR